MQPDAAALIWDARRAAQLILNFVAGRTWQDYQSDAMLRSAVERQFEVIGESLNRLSRADPITAASSRICRGSSRSAMFWSTATPPSTTCSSGRWPQLESIR
jgi:Ribonuclease HepT-like